MIKYFFARIRWGSLSPEQKEKVKALSFKELFSTPYLTPKLYINY